MSAAETWLPVLGFEGLYEVSSIGRVRSLPRVAARSGKGPCPVPGRVLTQTLHGGYPSVKISVNGRGVRRLVAHLVCEAWHGPRPDGAECRHLDDNRMNSLPSNLAWGTRSENMADRVRNGIDPNRTKTHCKHGRCVGHQVGKHDCRTCMRVWDQRYKARLRRLPDEVAAAVMAAVTPPAARDIIGVLVESLGVNVERAA